MFKKRTGLFLSLIASFFLFVTHVFAQDILTSKQDFSSSYDITYDVDESALTTVTEKITLKNLTSQFYASEYKLSIPAIHVDNVVATDDKGQKLQITISKQDNVTNIAVTFGSQVVGQGNGFSWVLHYTTKDFARKLGNVREITIPKLSTKSKLDDDHITLATPLDFGEPSVIFPAPKDQVTKDGKMILGFEKQDLQNSGISATFGNTQTYNFDLYYHIQNTGIFPILTTIALPPDTNYQEVNIKNVTPRPINVTIDQDGNYVAWYHLNRNQHLAIEATGSVRLYTKSTIKNPQLVDNARQTYTSANTYWEVNNPEIKQKLTEILKDTQNPTNGEKVRLIYQYVVGFLKYNPSRINTSAERFGAVSTLSNPTEAVCMEFTDLFIALARAAHIPARELDGFAYTLNQNLQPVGFNGDVLHSWPEYWDDQKGWVMVDPTWENTTGGVDYFNTLDLNHVVFAIKGFSPTQPLPAGSYKIDEKSQDVHVTLAQSDFLGKVDLQPAIKIPDEIVAGVPGRMTITLLNQGDETARITQMSVSAGRIVSQQQQVSTGVIPPFGYQDFSFPYKTRSFMDSFEDTITVRVGDKTFTKQVRVYPFFVFRFIPFAVVFLALGILLIYGSILGFTIYKRRSQKTQEQKVEAPHRKFKKHKPTM